MPLQHYYRNKVTEATPNQIFVLAYTGFQDTKIFRGIDWRKHKMHTYIRVVHYSTTLDLAHNIYYTGFSTITQAKVFIAERRLEFQLEAVRQLSFSSQTDEMYDMTAGPTKRYLEQMYKEHPEFII